MAGDVVQAQYDQLQSIAGRFGQWAESNAEMSDRVRQCVEKLMNGDWIGKGAEAFFNEMGSEVLPAMDRLTGALQQSQSTMSQIIVLIQEAEEEAASLFSDGHSYTPINANITDAQGHAIYIAASSDDSHLDSHSRDTKTPLAQGIGSGRSVNIEKAVPFIERWEGRKQRVYRDTKGNRTIGVGFNLERTDARAKIEAVGANFNDVLAGRQTLTDEQINTLLRSDVENCINRARDLVKNFDDLPNEAQTMVVDMIFNMGAGGFAGFKKTIDALEELDFARAANEMQDSKWYREGGRRPKHHVPAMRALAE